MEDSPRVKVSLTGAVALELIAPYFREAGFDDVASFGESAGRSALCGLHCIVGRKAP